LSFLLYHLCKFVLQVMLLLSFKKLRATEDPKSSSSPSSVSPERRRLLSS
jgi:hypothetical protein